MTILAALSLAVIPADALPLIHGWWILGGQESHVSFIDRQSIRADGNLRTAEVLTVLPQSVGIKAQLVIFNFDCEKKIGQTQSIHGIDLKGNDLGEILFESVGPQIVKSGSLGELALNFSCFENQKQLPELGYPIFLEPFETADHFFRLIGVGVERETASMLAAIDAERAPNTFEKLINAVVPSELHLYVRAIKTPYAEAPDTDKRYLD